MKKALRFYIVFLMMIGFCFTGISLRAQTGTVIQPGGLAFVHYRVNQTTFSNRLAFIVRAPIAKGTVVYISNRLWAAGSPALPGSWSNQNTSGVGTVTVTFTEDASVGQALFLEFTSASASTSIGTAIYTNHNTGDFTFDNKNTDLYVYQGSDLNTPTNFITQIAWKNAPSAANIGNIDASTKLIFTLGVGRTAYALGINGQSDKCGCWIQYVGGTIMPAINFSADLVNTFYSDLASGQFITATAASGAASIDPCNPESSPNNPFLFIANNIVFDYYRWGHPNDRIGSNNRWTKAAIPATWPGSPSNGWTYLDATDNATSSSDAGGTYYTPDWGAKTQTKRVILYDDLVLNGLGGSGFSASSTLSDAERVYKVAQLVVNDSLNDVTLTISPGSTLSIQDSVFMPDNNANFSGRIHLKSGVNGNGEMFYGQIAPTAATLQGTYSYDLYIKNPDWHHISSPISSTLADVQFTQQVGSTEPFAFNYNAGASTGTNAECNVFYWDNAKNGGTFWQPASGSMLTSAQPLTIFFDAAQVPCIMTITGTIPQAMRNPNKTLAYGADNTSAGSDVSSGYGAPNWVGAANKDGWNFYANPYLSFVSTSDLMANYSANMTSLNTSVYAWRPNRLGINDVSGSQGNYLVHNGSTGDANAANIPPFQAVFMQASGSGANTGLNIGKKARTTGILNSVLNKKNNPVVALTLAKDDSESTPEAVYLDIRKADFELSPSGKSRSDAPTFVSDGRVFAILHDSTFYKIKTVHEHADSLHQKVCVTHNASVTDLVLRNHPDFDESYVSFLYDRFTKTLTNLNEKAYHFNNDVRAYEYRFDWFIVPRSNTFLIEAMQNPPGENVWAIPSDGGLTLQANEFWKYPSSEVNVYGLSGELIFSTTGNVQNMFIPSRGKTEMVIIIIDDEISIKAILP